MIDEELEEEPEEKDESEQPDDLIKEVRDRLDRAFSLDSDNRALAIEDLHMENGDQWDQDELNRRAVSRRPAFTFNMLHKFVAQVTGDQKQNPIGIKISVADSNADPEIARIREGKIREIEYQSNAQRIYSEAFKQAVISGYGAWRIKTRYKDGETFAQEAHISPIANPFLVYSDPDAVMPEDREWAIVIENLSKEDFERRYPEAETPTNFNVSESSSAGFSWFDSETVTVAEYFVKKHTPKTIAQLSDGSVMPLDEAEAFIAQAQMQQISMLARMGQVLGMGAPLPPPPSIVNTREIDDVEVLHYIVTAKEILEGPDTWPGSKYIPVVELKGEQINLNGEVKVRGLIRFAKEPQKVYNYFKTLAAETIALAPKAPYIATSKQIGPHMDHWKRANEDNVPVLLYEADPAAPGKPERQQSVSVPSGIFAEIAKSEQDIESTIGIFKAGLGQPSNERSGKAIMARQRESDTMTFVYTDNLKDAVQYTGKVINEIFGKIYDTPGTMKLRDVDGTERFAPVNMPAGQAAGMIKSNPAMFAGMDASKLQNQMRTSGADAVFNDVTSGEYSVTVDSGPAYNTLRQEAAENLMRLVQANPEILKIAGDIIFGVMDMPQSDVLASRFEALLPPNLKPQKEGKPEPPPKPNVKQQIEMEKIKNERMALEVEKMRIQGEIADSKKEIRQIVLESIAEIASTGGMPNA